jgi:hypothetical protein
MLPNMGNSHPSLNMLYMIKHHKHILHIITQLHLLNQIEFGRSSIDGHLEQMNLLPLEEKHVFSISFYDKNLVASDICN